MHGKPSPPSKITAAITGYAIRKSAGGTERYVLPGMASNTNIGLTGERMAENIIWAMAKSLQGNAVTINYEHGSSCDDDFGEVANV